LTRPMARYCLAMQSTAARCEGACFGCSCVCGIARAPAGSWVEGKPGGCVRGLPQRRSGALYTAIPVRRMGPETGLGIGWLLRDRALPYRPNARQECKRDPRTPAHFFVVWGGGADGFHDALHVHDNRLAHEACTVLYAVSGFVYSLSFILLAKLGSAGACLLSRPDRRSWQHGDYGSTQFTGLPLQVRPQFRLLTGPALSASATGLFRSWRWAISPMAISRPAGIQYVPCVLHVAAPPLCAHVVRKRVVFGKRCNSIHAFSRPSAKL
jgi:hypothetical protein